MDKMENNEMNMKKDHMCPTNGHCCKCDGCGGMCMHGGMRKYWRRHFLVLILGVILAFFVGMKLGEIKGYMMGMYGMVPMHRGYMMQDRDMGMQTNQMAPMNGTMPAGTQAMPGTTTSAQ